MAAGNKHPRQVTLLDSWSSAKRPALETNDERTVTRSLLDNSEPLPDLSPPGPSTAQPEQASPCDGTCCQSDFSKEW